MAIPSLYVRSTSSSKLLAAFLGVFGCRLFFSCIFIQVHFHVLPPVCLLVPFLVIVRILVFFLIMISWALSKRFSIVTSLFYFATPSSSSSLSLVLDSRPLIMVAPRGLSVLQRGPNSYDFFILSPLNIGSYFSSLQVRWVLG